MKRKGVQSNKMRCAKLFFRLLGHQQGQNVDCAGSSDFNEHLTVDSVSFRCVSYLVEAAFKKDPPENEFGTSEQVL